MSVWRKTFGTIEAAVIEAREVLPHLSLGEDPIEDYWDVVKAFKNLAGVTLWRSPDCEVSCTVRPHYLYYSDQAIAFQPDEGQVSPCSLQIDQADRWGGDGFIVNAHCPLDADWRFAQRKGWEEYRLPPVVDR